MIRFFKIAASIMVLAVLLAGCDSVALWHQTNDDYDKNSKAIKTENASVTKPPPAVTTKQQAYVDTKPVSLNRAPDWYTAPVSINGAQMPFSFYLSQLLGNAPVNVHMDPGVNPARMVTLHYSGTVKGALAELASKSNYFYDYDIPNKTLTWSSLQTKVFDISFIPGVSKYSVGPSSGVSIASGSSGSSSSGSSSSSSSSSSGIDITATGEYSNISNDNLSVWDDMKSTIATLLSPQGKLSVSQATTTITVRDHPSNISDVSHYLAKMNKILSKQVHFDVQVLDVQLNKQFQYGIDWNDIAYKFSHNGGKVSFDGTFATTSGAVLTAPPQSAGTYAPGGKWSGNIVIKALEEQGKVTVVTQPSLTTLNDQVAQIAIQTQQSYLASQSTTITGGDSSLSQEALTPGTVTYGFQMYLLPKIQDDKVYLQISSVLSDLISLTIVTQTGQTSAGNDTQNSTNAIQVPNLAQKNFNQRTVLRNGQTLVLAGFKNLKDNNQKDTVAGLTPLGGLAAQSNNEEMVVLITPTILNGDNF